MATKKKSVTKVEKKAPAKKKGIVKKQSEFKKYRWMLFGALAGAGVSLFFILA